MPITYHPDKYTLHVDVDPPHQRRGIGSALFGRLLDVLRERRAVLVRAEAKESRRNSLDFLIHRGCREVQRYWESRLDVKAFDFAPFDGAEARTAREGIAITTLAAELAQHPDRLRAVYEMDQTCLRDVPFPDPTTPLPYEEYVQHVVESPGSLHDGFFLAKDGNRYVGVSNLNRNERQPDVLHQGFTGVLREYRGKGIAMALKLQTVRYARTHGYREIRTFNNTLNRPMLRINEAMGFQKQPVWIELERAV